MRKKIFGRKFSRERDTRRALFRSLVRALVEHGQIKTTKAKAKAIKPLIERLVRDAKKKDTTHKRKVFAALGNDKVTARKIFQMADKLFLKRESGFVKTINLPKRRGDNAEMVRLEFVEKLAVEEPKTKTKKQKKAKTTRKAKTSKTKKEDKKEKKEKSKK